MFPKGGTAWNKRIRSIIVKNCKYCRKEFDCNSHQRKNTYCSLACASRGNKTENFRKDASERMKRNNPMFRPSAARTPCASAHG